MAKPKGPEAGMTLVELLIGLAIGAMLIVGALALLDEAERGRQNLTAKNDAETQNNLFAERLQRYFRTRMTTRKDGGFFVGKCRQPGPLSPCIEIFRRQRRGGVELTERFRFKGICRKLTVREAFGASSMKLPGTAIAASARDVCGLTCRTGEKPVIILRHFPDEKVASFHDYEFPAGDRLAPISTATGGFCVNASPSREEVHIVQGMTILRNENGWRFKLLKKDFVLTPNEDASRIEWLP